MTVAPEAAPARQDTTCRAGRVVDRTGCNGTRHGDATAYKAHHCRCPDARADAGRRNKAQRLGIVLPGVGLVPSTGTARRLQALTAIGWDLEGLACELGISRSRVGRLRSASNLYASRAVASRVAALYGRLQWTPGPSERARTWAARCGWAPPLAWDDIDDPAAQPVGLRRVTSRRLEPCGSVAAWRRHRRAGEPACDACREAKRVDSAQKRAAS